MTLHSDYPAENSLPGLVWIYPGRLDAALDSSTWLKTTSELRQIGWKVTLISAGGRGIQSVQGVEVLSFPSPEIFFIRQLVFHTRLIFYLLSYGRSPHVILFNQPSALWLFPLYFLRQLRGKRWPLFVMDTRTVPMENSANASLRDRLRGWFMLAMNRFGGLWVDGQTAITRRMAERIRIQPDHLWGVWSSAADLPVENPGLKNRRWPAAEEPVHLVYVGVLHYERNLMALCEAVEMANENGMNFTLTLTGGGTQSVELTAFARKSMGRVRVNPPIPHDQIPNVLQAGHVGVIPFPDEEKFRVSSPIKLFEYMAAGLPVFATRIVCHTDVIGGDNFVFWSEGASPTDLLLGLKKVWQARSRLGAMSAESRARARSFTWAESAGKLSDALLAGFERRRLYFPAGVPRPARRAVE